ncbi:MAG: NADH dehydrogenase [Bacteroidetes bacterium RIFCSPLOWO2_02_FULL_36_8]|nr:MAG: NADH dehydrogenase [Bacteroidetes bacterium RIFCSPLOWO2_02_FULL_36_8]OFY69647.1 MAG: NADH dehydrogenase [Bacteroidetes bacterium RIFCSPLOWO2_12_FULL_37_12]
MLHEIKSLLIDKFGSEVIQSENPSGLQPWLAIKVDFIEKVCHELHDNPKTFFDFLSCLSGVDNGPQQNTLEVIYNLCSIPHKTQLTLKVIVPRQTEDGSLPSVPSVCSVWGTANWHEREAYDMIGINFINHPDLRRILCPQDWEGYPLRKDYKTQEFYHGIKVEY